MNDTVIKQTHITKSNSIAKIDELDDIFELSTIKLFNSNMVNEFDDDKQSTKNKIWKHIFNEIKYNGNNEIIITADEIKKCGKTWKGVNNQFEPRLLCKQDCVEDKPQIFKDYNLSIISIKNGEYLLTKNTIYFNLEYSKEKIYKIKKNNKSLLLNIANSESSLMDNLRYSGLFEKSQYLGEKILFGSLLSGRHRCSFKTKLGQTDIEIIGSQCEKLMLVMKV